MKDVGGAGTLGRRKIGFFFSKADPVMEGLQESERVGALWIAFEWLLILTSRHGDLIKRRIMLSGPLPSLPVSNLLCRTGCIKDVI